MEQPEGFRVQGQEHFVLRLKRALYGLKQAGLAWWRMLRESMLELGFEGLVSDAGLFIFRNEHSFVIAVIYVDDSLFCGPNAELVKELKNKFMQRWECRDLVSSRIFFTIFTFLFNFLSPPLYPTSSPSFPFHAFTSHDKTIKTR